MVLQTGLGMQLLVYGALAVAVPLCFVLLVRLVDRLSLDAYVDQYEAVTPGASQGFAATPADDKDEAICPRCGERNEREFEFCRSCVARVAD